MFAETIGGEANPDWRVGPGDRGAQAELLSLSCRALLDAAGERRRAAALFGGTRCFGKKRKWRDTFPAIGNRLMQLRTQFIQSLPVVQPAFGEYQLAQRRAVTTTRLQ